ncbi:MAG: hypothetical protein IJP18_06655 [Oscillospiraceae bacterium]|nr:hypothetical protein [Oscillospiraceae bacterium]MBQ9982231.1 hypothetical protein [Oscillospiraceae bacterium]MBR6599335.1 hypothetical protein [Oscillospiraceae bacterium]
MNVFLKFSKCQPVACFRVRTVEERVYNRSVDTDTGLKQFLFTAKMF